MRKILLIRNLHFIRQWKWILREIDIIGGTGSRADHFMTSVMNLKFCADKKNIKAAIYDKNNKIYLIENGMSVSIKKEKTVW